LRFGVLLPHYGEHCTPSKLIEGSQLIEELGFDSVWVRDHLLWKPHGMEGTNNTFVDAFVTLAAVAGATKRVELGTAVLIPIRWPLKVAQNFASLSFISSGRRIDCGFGMGSNHAELAAAGFDAENREAIFVETVQICKRMWEEDGVSWEGEQFRFEDVTLNPKPTGPMALWYGGTTRASCRRAAAHTDGWLPGRLPMATFDDRLSLLQELGEERGSRVKVGVIPLFSIDEDRGRARKDIDVDALANSSEGSKRWIKPPSGRFETVEDLEGLVIAGTPEDCVAEIRKFEERGVDDFIFDLRLQFTDYEQKLELIAREVLPHVREAALL
jgi:alkanesulfonate monooxygenase SsuD/methylene tetrahydromethanopterin reductase-like flavin-dependent oxidoreductase (luciferase family)